MVGFLLVILGVRADLFSHDGDDPMEQREEKLKAFRAKRDQFFKEDPHSPLKESDRKKTKGLLYYPIDLKYAVIGSIERYPSEPKSVYINLPTSKGREKKYVKYGQFRFKREGKEYVLHIYRPLGGGELFLPLETKPLEKRLIPEGRYLYIEPLPGGKVLIDFNRAYNPFCEYREKLLCP